MMDPPRLRAAACKMAAVREAPLVLGAQRPRHFVFVNRIGQKIMNPPPPRPRSLRNRPRH